MNRLKHIPPYFTQLPILMLLLTLPVSCEWNTDSNPLSASFHADSSDESAPVDYDLDQIREKGSITAILNNSSTGYFLYRGQPMGYEYELLTRMAEALDLELNIKITNDIEEAFALLNSGEGDIIAFNMTVTAPRAERVAFTEHHNEVRQVLVQQKPDQWRKIKQHRLEKNPDP